MRPIPEDGNLIAFADLRPDHVETDVKGNEVVALLLHESSYTWRVNTPGASEHERVEERAGYIVFELNAAGQVTGDWGIDDDLDDARGFLDEKGSRPMLPGRIYRLTEMLLSPKCRKGLPEGDEGVSARDRAG